MRIYIGYQDGTGVITEREISDLRKETDKTIDAFCHLRDDRRSINVQLSPYGVSVAAWLASPFRERLS